MRWLANLSGRQRLWLALVSVVALAIVVVGVLRQEATMQAQPVTATVDMSMKQIAPQLGVTGKSLARELGLPLDTAKEEPLEALGDLDQDYDPCLSGDGQELYFTRGKAGGDANLYVAYRTLDGWTEPRPLEALNTPADEIGPALARDGATLYFYSNRPGGEGGYDLYVSRHSDAGWSDPKNLGPRVNGPFNEYDPAVTPDGAYLLFASNRPVEGEEPDEKTWRATLREEPYQNDYDVYALDLEDDAAAPRRLDAVCSRADDGQPTVSPDGHWLYFASDRAGGQGGYDLWRSRVTVRPLAGSTNPVT